MFLETFLSVCKAQNNQLMLFKIRVMDIVIGELLSRNYIVNGDESCHSSCRYTITIRIINTSFIYSHFVKQDTQGKNKILSEIFHFSIYSSNPVFKFFCIDTYINYMKITCMNKKFREVQLTLDLVNS